MVLVAAVDNEWDKDELAAKLKERSEHPGVFFI